MRARRHREPYSHIAVVLYYAAKHRCAAKVIQGGVAVKAEALPLQYNAVDILERNLPQRADKVALYSESRNMTFRQVAEEANQVGNALKALDVRVGEFVGILSPDMPEWV